MKNVRNLRLLFALSLPVFYVFWLIFVGTFALHELLVGIIGAVLASLGLAVIERFYPARFSPTLSELLKVWRLPWYVISETWLVSVVAGKDLLGIERAKSLFRVARFRAGKNDDPSDTARRVLAVAYSTAAPNFIVLGINSCDGTMLFHQVEPSSISKLTQELGAQA